MPNDLTYVPTAELLGELFSRHESALFIGNTRRNQEYGLLDLQRHGNQMSCIGLARWAERKLLEGIPEFRGDGGDV